MLIIIRGGLAISQTEENTTKLGSYTCPNSACGKVFTKPIKALNLQRSPDQFYNACPYCLTEITEETKRTVAPPPEKTLSCTHYLGYLCERSTNDSIPDECIVCKDLTTCMLKNMER
jgi:hypothetical protein